jgi:hypothetical protein
MLDRVRNAISPASTSAEIVGIEGRLAALDAEREEHRLAAGHLVTQQAAGYDPARDVVVRKHHVRIAEIDEQRSELHGRRRNLLNLLKPAPVVTKSIVDVQMSAELIAASGQLDAARATRQSLIAERLTDQNEAHEKKRAKKIADVEDEILHLRRLRSELLEPYNAEMSEALAPYIRAAATKLSAAGDQFLEAMRDFGDINLLLPPMATGYGNGLEPLMGVNTTPVLAAQNVCRELLARNPSVPE